MIGDPPDAHGRIERHEAAHAVVGHALGSRIRLVVVRRGATISGFTEHHVRTDLSPLEQAADDVTMLAAGEIGELIRPASGYFEPLDDDATAIEAAVDAILGSLPPDDRGFIAHVLADDRPESHPGDAARAEAIATRAAGEQRSLFLAFCRARAEYLVWSNVDAIQALAAELSRRPILDGEAAERIISEVREMTRLPPVRNVREGRYRGGRVHAGRNRRRSTQAHR